MDVREPAEYEAFNLDGKLIPLGVLAVRLNEIEDYRDEEIVVHCKVGGRSARAKQFLEQSGFKKVRNLLGGTDAWVAKFGQK